VRPIALASAAAVHGMTLTSECNAELNRARYEHRATKLRCLSDLL